MMQIIFKRSTRPDQTTVAVFKVVIVSSDKGAWVQFDIWKPEIYIKCKTYTVPIYI